MYQGWISNVDLSEQAHLLSPSDADAHGFTGTMWGTMLWNTWLLLVFAVDLRAPAGFLSVMCSFCGTRQKVDLIQDTWLWRACA